jgi:hypothetical protein
MPHFIEGLGNVEECSGAVLLGVEGCVDSLDKTVGWVDCGKHNVNVATGKKRLQLESMLC